jgi:myosin regulatory light chain 12
MVMERRKTRQSSNVFHMLSKAQLMELREAFNLIDRDSDSKLSVEDLTIFLESIGSPYTEEEIREMIKELEPNPTFIVLLTLIGERLSEIDSENSLIEAFRIFDDNNDGLIETNFLKKWLTEEGEPISKEAYEYLVKGCLEEGMVNYRKLASKMKHGEIIENETTRSNNIE